MDSVQASFLSKTEQRSVKFTGVSDTASAVPHLEQELLWRAPSAPLETQETRRFPLVISDETSRWVSLTPVPGDQPPNHENATKFKTNRVSQQLNNKSLPKSIGPIVVRHNENNSHAVSNLMNVSHSMKGLMTKPNLELYKFNGDPTK